jgi:hypothetical protein
VIAVPGTLLRAGIADAPRTRDTWQDRLSRHLFQPAPGCSARISCTGVRVHGWVGSFEHEASIGENKAKIFTVLRGLDGPSVAEQTTPGWHSDELLRPSPG